MSPAASFGMVSIVIIGRNEGVRLERCLESVSRILATDFSTETIYVDSGSIDQSLAIARSHGAKTFALASTRPTAALARNAGWQAAQGEFILFLDGDTVLDPRFVADSLDSFADPRVAVVWGHRREMFPSHSVYMRVLDLDWIYAPGFTEFCGGDALFRRAVLQAADGFDETLIAGEEPELCRRILGLNSPCTRILHVDRSMTLHDLEILHFRPYWRRATRAGHAFAEVSERFAGTPNPFWLADARRNRTRALTLLALPLFALAAALLLRTLWPLALFGALAALLVIRTAWKARWKSRDRTALLLYGLHSHLQQIPIFFGQLQFLRNRSRGRRASLVEYKQL